MNDIGWDRVAERCPEWRRAEGGIIAGCVDGVSMHTGFELMWD